MVMAPVVNAAGTVNVRYRVYSSSNGNKFRLHFLVVVVAAVLVIIVTIVDFSKLGYRQIPKLQTITQLGYKPVRVLNHSFC